MERLEQRGRAAANSRAALRHAGTGLVCLVAGMILGGLTGSDGLPLVLPVVAGFLALVAFVRRALVLWNVDALLFDNPSRDPRLPARPRQTVRPGRYSTARRNALRLVRLTGIGLLSSAAISGHRPSSIFPPRTSSIAASSTPKRTGSGGQSIAASRADRFGPSMGPGTTPRSALTSPGSHRAAGRTSSPFPTSASSRFTPSSSR